MHPNGQFPAHLWFICLRVCMSCFALRVFCIVIGGARDLSFGVCSLGGARIPSCAAAYDARRGGSSNYIPALPCSLTDPQSQEIQFDRSHLNPFHAIFDGLTHMTNTAHRQYTRKTLAMHQCTSRCRRMILGRIRCIAQGWPRISMMMLSNSCLWLWCLPLWSCFICAVGLMSDLSSHTIAPHISHRFSLLAFSVG